MTSRISNFCIDAQDPYAIASWWSDAVDDFTVDPESSPGDPEVNLFGPAGRVLIFLKVPETKTVKNRMHFCVRPVNITRDEEVDRLIAAGARMEADLREPDAGWAVLLDPEGNEFCVLTADADSAGIQRQP